MPKMTRDIAKPEERRTELTVPSKQEVLDALMTTDLSTDTPARLMFDRHAQNDGYAS